jgi:hypothetical protein
MRHFNMLVAVAATLLVGGAAVAKDKTEAPKEKKICRMSEDTTSRIGAHRICRTKAEWEQGSEESQRDAERAVEDMNRHN